MDSILKNLDIFMIGATVTNRSGIMQVWRGFSTIIIKGTFKICQNRK